MCYDDDGLYYNHQITHRIICTNKETEEYLDEQEVVELLNRLVKENNELRRRLMNEGI